MLNKNLYLTVQ